MAVIVFGRRRQRNNTTACVEARVRRALLRHGEMLRKPRSQNERREFGDYFTADTHNGNPERRHCELEQLAREYGVLLPGEVIGE